MTAFLTAAAYRAGDRYVTLLEAMDRTFMSIAISANMLNEAGSIRLQSALVAIGAEHAGSEMEHLGDDVAETLRIAQRDVLEHLGYSVTSDATNDLSDDLESSELYAANELSTQIRRDIEQTVKRHRDLRIQVRMGSSVNMQGRDLTLAQIVADTRRRRTWFTDRSGRRWPSQKFVRALWRQTLLEFYVTAYMTIAAEYGEKQVLIWHPDSTHRYYGLEVSLLDGGAGFDERSAVFHPNSEALPRVERFFQEVMA